jgi:hypothetical protein
MQVMKRRFVVGNWLAEYVERSREQFDARKIIPHIVDRAMELAFDPFCRRNVLHCQCSTPFFAFV